jgi:hypothetical protein
MHASDSALGYHVMIRLDDDRVLTRNTDSRRIAARVFLRHGRRAGLVAFAIADTHAHAVVVCPRAAAGRFAHAVEIALSRQLKLEVCFEPARIKAIRTQRHLYSCFYYVLRQDDHHGLGVDRAREGTSLPDLLGLRVGAGFVRDNVRSLLPRVDVAAFWSMVALDEMRPLDALRATLGLARSEPIPPHGLRALAHVLEGDTNRSAALLARSRRAVQRMRAGKPDPALLAALRARLAIASPAKPAASVTDLPSAELRVADLPSAELRAAHAGLGGVIREDALAHAAIPSLAASAALSSPPPSPPPPTAAVALDRVHLEPDAARSGAMSDLPDPSPEN